MKRFLLVLLTFSLLTGTIFAEEEYEADEYDDGYVYEQNAAGDQYIKADFFANLPLSFNGKLYVGAGFNLGYYRFLNNWLAIGGEIAPIWNLSIGQKSLIMLPITLGAFVQPTIKNFEFPIGITLGIASTTWQNNITMFPCFVAKATGGAWYRFNEGWSFGIDASFMWIPQYFENPKYNSNGLFIQTGIALRHHF